MPANLYDGILMPMNGVNSGTNVSIFMSVCHARILIRAPDQIFLEGVGFDKKREYRMRRRARRLDRRERITLEKKESILKLRKLTHGPQ